MAYQVIARKWRPQTFADLVGQSHVTETLANAIKQDRVAHAYIFSGARGVGKTTAARILAKALNCEKGPTPEPCGECASCKEIAAGNSLDVIEIDAASNRGIDQIRELNEMVRYAPAAARRKVVILDEAHMLTTDASNALLKTLEEPPDRVIFVMATTEPEELVDTIRSRSQHFHFRALTFNEIVGRLQYIAGKESLKIDDGALAVIARMADGSMRDSLSLLEQARAYCGDNIADEPVRALLGVVPEDALNELVEAIATKSADRAFGLVNTFQKEGRNLQHFCREAIRHVRNLLIVRVCGAESELVAATPDQRPGLAKAAALFQEEDLTRFFQILLQTDDDLRRKPDPRVHLEMGLLRLVNAARLAPLEELLNEMKSNGSGTSGPTGGGTKSAPPATRAPFTPPTPSRAIGAASAAPSFPPPATSFSPAAVAKSEPAPTLSSPFATSSGSAAAAAPALKPVEADPVPAAPSKPAAAATAGAGISAEHIAAIKSALAEQQKFLGELLEHATTWEIEGAELRILFPAEKSTFISLVEGRDTMDKIRAAATRVLGRTLRVCARLDSSAGIDANNSRSASSTQQMRERFEKDPVVKSMLQRFGGRITEVRRRVEE